MKLLTLLTIFSLFVLFNIYIRVKTMGYYKELVVKRIQFNFSQMFSKSRWQTEVLSKFPEDTAILNRFRTHIFKTGILFIVVILLVILMLAFLKNQMLQG
ncbi:MAG: hypothetical protein IPI50_09160 [Saprospiraceae bacterium]|nr:hypothetical protein [Saprospiraceae bacterium]